MPMMPMFIHDVTFILLIPAMILAAWAQFRVSSNFNKYSKVMSRRGRTGADIARELLRNNGIYDVEVEMGRGHLTDHYDPRSRKVVLSESVYDSPSIAAISVAAHEVGHAMQHNSGYVPLSLRSLIVPVASFGSRIAFPLLLFGIMMGEGGALLVDLGIIFFASAVFFQIITLPVEFNASRRAIAVLSDGMYLDEEEVRPARKVLNAAAMTYVAATFMALMQLLRMLALSGRRR